MTDRRRQTGLEFIVRQANAVGPAGQRLVAEQLIAEALLEDDQVGVEVLLSPEERRS